jgi:hypothetical protein
MAASVPSANEGSQIATVTGSALTDQFDAVLARIRHPAEPELPRKGDCPLQGAHPRRSWKSSAAIPTF